MISMELADRLHKYYKGKLCSIMTAPFALSLDAKDYPQWFTVIVDDIDQEAILGTDFNRGTKHVFFFGPQLLGIAEEQVIPPDHPEYDKIKQKFQEKTRKDQDLTHKETMPTKSEPLQLPILPSNASAIDKVSQKAAELKKKWGTSAVDPSNPRVEV